jgi:hypothetical protein
LARQRQVGVGSQAEVVEFAPGRFGKAADAVMAALSVESARVGKNNRGRVADQPFQNRVRRFKTWRVALPSG